MRTIGYRIDANHSSDRQPTIGSLVGLVDSRIREACGDSEHADGGDYGIFDRVAGSTRTARSATALDKTRSGA